MSDLRRDRGARESLGKYRFVAALGQGGMAEVFLAMAVGPAGFNKLQVIKRLRPALADDPDVCDMFLDEARLAARLNHHNVVQTNEVGFVDSQYFMVMEYLDGQPLHRVLGRVHATGHRLPPALISRICCDVLSGLHYAHELTDYDGTPLGVVHRDVSPQNIFITYDGQVKLVDFGIAKAARRVVETQAGVIKGKLAYMAPEQALGRSSEIDRRADLFSVGVVLWEAIVGRRLWHGLSHPEILAALSTRAPSVLLACPDAPVALAGVCDKALSPARGPRHATAAELRGEIERAASPCSADQLGAFVEEMFHEQRLELRAKLAQQVDLVAQDRAGGLLDLRRASESMRSIPSISPASTPPVSASDTPPPSSVTPSGLFHSELLAPTHLEGRRARRALGGALVVAACAGLYLLLVGGREPARVAASHDAGAPAHADAVAEASSDPTVLASAGAGAEAYVQVHIRGDPVAARIFVDDAAVPSNPFDGRFLRDGAVHRIRIEAKGFVPVNRLVVFDEDVSIEVPLQARPRPVDEVVVEIPGMKPNPYQ